MQGFTGRDNEEEFGLMYYRARYYDPDTGRFISPDPFTRGPDDPRISYRNSWYSAIHGEATLYASWLNPHSFNRYLYCNNNPVGNTDPLGLKLRLVGNKKNRKRLHGWLNRIAGTKLNVNKDGYVSGKFKSPKGYSKIGGWLKEIIGSKKTVGAEISEDALLGGSFDHGNVKVNPNPEDFSYRGEGGDDWVEKYLLGKSYDFTGEGVLAHELLGHGLDWVQKGNKYLLNNRDESQKNSIKRANMVRTLIGIPKRKLKPLYSN